jgi:hypothetical protein
MTLFFGSENIGFFQQDKGWFGYWRSGDLDFKTGYWKKES